MYLLLSFIIEKYASFVQCRLHMAIGTYEDTSYGCARRWFKSVNLGDTFGVIVPLIHSWLWKGVLDMLSSESQDQKDVVKKLMLDEDILFTLVYVVH